MFAHRLIPIAVAAGAVLGFAHAAVSTAAPNYGPHQAFSEVLGSKHALGYFEQRNGRCFLTLMVSESFEEAGQSAPASAARLAFAIGPRETAEVASAEMRSLTITCAADASSVAIATTGSNLM